jgi:hypothetical protein
MVCIDNGMVWYGMTWYALYDMVCNGMKIQWQWYGMHWYGMVLDTLAMVCKGNFNFMHWQWYAKEIATLYVGNGMHCLSIVWYGIVWHTIPLPCIIWYIIHVMHDMICIALLLYGMH